MESEGEDSRTATGRQRGYEEKEKKKKRKRAEGQRSKAESKAREEEVQANKDESLILGGSGVLVECERICSPQSCLQEVLLKFHRWLHSLKGFFIAFFLAEPHKLPIPSFMCGKV